MWKFVQHIDYLSQQESRWDNEPKKKTSFKKKKIGVTTIVILENYGKL